MAPAWRRSALVAAVVCAAAFEARCGARSDLPLLEACAKEGSQRGCNDACGVGQQVCKDGYWQLCVVPTATRPCSSVCGPGTEACTDGTWQACTAPLPGPPTLQATVRNIHVGQPDFKQSCCTGGVDPGIVGPTLGADGTPVYANPGGTLTTHGQADFASWYHDVPGVSLSAPLSLPFQPVVGQAGVNAFDNEAFFPIDGQLFGNQGGDHNYDFTVETHAQILYVGGETYGFASDDDLFVFINRRLVVDLGGYHPRMSQSIALDDVAAQAGIVVGQTFPLDVFYADREPTGAVLVISIPQTDLWSCP
jgi:fibro-slime domain-containing protein